MKKNKRIVTFLLILIILVTNLNYGFISEASSDDLQLNLSSKSDIDVVLTLGETNVNASNFEIDLKNKLAQMGVDRNRVKVSAIETSTISTNDEDAELIFNQWEKFPTYSNWFYDLENKWIYSEDNPAYETGFIKNMQDESGNFSIITEAYSNQPSQPLGLVFRVQQTEADPTRYNMYYWWASGTHAILFKVENIKINNPREYWGGTYSGTPLLSYAKGSGKSECEIDYCLGWPQHAPYDYGGFPHATPLRIGETVNNLADPIVKTTILNFAKVSHTMDWHKIGVEVKGDTIKTTFDSTELITRDSSLKKGSAGFFQYSHVLPKFKDIEMTFEESRKFSEVIREPDWRDDSKRFLINLDDNKVSDFDNPSALGEILTRLINEEIHYVSWGTSENKSQMLDFIKKNNNNGTFLYNSNYNDYINKTAQYIFDNIQVENMDSQYVLVGEPIDVKVSPAHLATNTQNSAYPQGRWRIDHDYDYFHNSMGQANWANQWQKDLKMVFDKPGKYEVFFEDSNPNPRYIYAHRRPIADFSSIVTRNGNNFYVSFGDLSYDPDLEYNADDGLAVREWKWKLTTDSNWTNGKPSTLSIGQNYLVQLRVKDHQDVWSIPQSRYISTDDNITVPPVSNFNISPNPVSMYQTLTVNDTSYDPAGRTITGRNWVVTRENGSQIWNSSSQLTNFKNYGAGEYTISLKVRNDANLWSETFSRKLTVTSDNEAPEAIISPTSHDWTTDNIGVRVNYTEPGGSGFKYQRYALSTSPSKPSSGWSSFDSSTVSNLTVNSEGSWYLHIEAHDNAGNILNQSMGTYKIDRTAPTATHSLSPSAWTDGNISINVVGNDAGSGIKRIRLPNGNYHYGSSVSYSVVKNGEYPFVIEDNLGHTKEYNVSITNKYINPILTANPIPSEDYIKLNWSLKDKWQNYNYMIYQKKPGDSEFQTIPVTDRLKVLEVYPYVSVLKEWTNSYGQGKITTSSVSIEDFNINPEQVWNYDVVVFGFSDSNSEKDISATASNIIEEYMNAGKGVLFGHDTLRPNILQNFTRLAPYVNISYSPVGWSGRPWNQLGINGNKNTNIILKRKGFLTNYPYKVGEPGTILTSPYTHTVQQIANGDIWVKFVDANNPNLYMDTNENFYLTTWNNTAMIQTGHSIRPGNTSQEWATEDEQKLVVNTLFYLGQITNITSWDDRTGQDVTAPTEPNIQSVIANGDNSKVNIKYNASEDNGTNYNYYVEATGEKNGAKSISNIETATIKSGLKGYSIVVDNNPNTIPDISIETTVTNYEIDKSINRDFYVHVASVDKVGNISEVSHFHYTDTTKPELVLSIDNSDWTNGNITIKAIASDTGSGVRKIKLPNDSWMIGNSTSYVVSENGNYTFVAEDYLGNQTTKTIKITNIDKTAPSSPSITHNLDWTNASQVPVTISSGTDAQSGVNRTEYSLSGATTLGWTTYSGVINVTNEGVTKVTARTIDNLGHISDITTSNVRIDRTLPHATSIIINDNAVFSNSRSVTLTLNAMDSASGVDKMQIKNEDGSWSTEEAYKISKAWTLSSTDGTKTVWVRYKDLAGNWSNPVKDTIELDMTAPVITKFTIQDDREYYNNHYVHLNLKADDNLSGIKEMYISNDNVNFTKKSYAEKISWTLSSGEGIKTVYLKILDTAGNMTNIVSDKIFIDTVKPTGSIIINNGDEQTMSRDVKLKIDFSDNVNGSGIDIVKVVENDNEFVFPSVPSSPRTIDWRLSEGVGLKTVHLVLVDKAGNVSDDISDSIIVDKLSIERFTLTDVINPMDYPLNIGFTPKDWTFEPQDMLSGANISFSLNLKEAYDSSVVNDSVIYKVEIIGSGYHKALTGDMLHQVADNYSKAITLPEDAPKGSKVYVIATATRELLVSPFDIQVEYFPGVEATTKAQIGIIEGNIYEAIRFNETN